MLLKPGILRPHQHEILEICRSAVLDGKTAFIYGGKGVFKTSTMVFALYYWLKTLSHFYSGMRIVVAAASYQQIRDVFVETWSDQVPRSAWEYGDNRTTIQLNGTDTKLWLRYSGDGVDGASAERASTRRRGSNITGYYFPQCESVSSAYYNEITSRLRGEPTRRFMIGGKPYEIYPPYQIRWLDSNPEGEHHWLKRLFLDGGAGSIKDSCLSMGIPANEETSIYTADQLAQFRKTWPEHEVARMLDSRWVGSSGQVFWIRDQHRTLESLPNPRYYLSFDFGYEDEFVCLLIESQGKHIFVRDECSGRKMFKDSHMALVRVMLERNGNPKLTGLAGDYSGTYHDDTIGNMSSMWWFGNELNVVVMRSIKDRYDGILKLLEMLETTGELHGRPQLTFHRDKCERTILSLGSLIWHKSKKDVEPHADDHHADACRYAVMSGIQVG